MLSAGVLIAGKYRVIKKLGEGAMGSVWLAKNEVTDREFAIKVLLPEAAASDTALARFLREAKVCGALRHPSILEIYDAGTAVELGGAPYLVMERLDGAPLDVVLSQSGRLAPRLALDIVVQISRGLQLAHAKGIVHRDLKPANVFLHSPGTGALEPKVLDFGISKVIDKSSPQIALTHTSAILGSPIYMSPEQMGAGTVFDARSDVHALGILLWECLTGRPPFLATSYNLLVVEILQGPRPRLRDVLPSASKDLASATERAFAIDPESRFASAADFADVLEAELTKLGGGVLGSRTAVTDVLGKLNLDSLPPPSSHASTTDPHSMDPLQLSPAARSIAGTLVSRGSTPGSPSGSNSGARSGARSSPDSFAETEVAAGNVRPQAPAAAASGSREVPSAQAGSGRKSAWLVASATFVAVLAAVAVMIASRHPSKPADVATTEPPASASLPVATASASSASAVNAVDASVPAVASAAPTVSASPVSSASPAKKTPSHARPATPPPAPRPRIDQSGL